MGPETVITKERRYWTVYYLITIYITSIKCNLMSPPSLLWVVQKVKLRIIDFHFIRVHENLVKHPSIIYLIDNYSDSSISKCLFVRLSDLLYWTMNVVILALKRFALKSLVDKQTRLFVNTRINKNIDYFSRATQIFFFMKLLCIKL